MCKCERILRYTDLTFLIFCRREIQFSLLLQMSTSSVLPLSGRLTVYFKKQLSGTTFSNGMYQYSEELNTDLHFLDSGFCILQKSSILVIYKRPLCLLKIVCVRHSLYMTIHQHVCPQHMSGVTFLIG